MLSEFPSAKHVANAHLTRLSNLLFKSSKGQYSKETAITFREAVKISIDSKMPAKSLELKHTIKLIQEITSVINEIENEIKLIMNGIDSPDKILAYAGFSPSTYQS